MAYAFDINEVPSTGAEVFFRLKSLLKQQGWNVVSSSDGTTVAAGDFITSPLIGAHGMLNANAWYFLQAPTPYTRSLIIQRGISNQGWRMKYSPVAGFFSGSAAATQTPSATDEITVLGGGTDAAPTFSAAFLPADGTYRFHACAGGTSENYPFYFFVATLDTVIPQAAIMIDVMQSGSYPSQDPDPAVVYTSNTALTGSMFATDFTTVGNKVFCQITSSLSGTNIGFVNVHAQAIGSLFPGGIALNPYTNRDEYMPIPWARSNANPVPVGWKGLGTLTYWAGFYRQNFDLMTFNSVKDRIFIGNISLPWAGVDIAI